MLSDENESAFTTAFATFSWICLMKESLSAQIRLMAFNEISLNRFSFTVRFSSAEEGSSLLMQRQTMTFLPRLFQCLEKQRFFPDFVVWTLQCHNLF